MSLKNLTIDTSAWQNKSAEWHERRQAKWPIIEKWFERYWVEWSSFPKGEESSAYHQFFLTGEIDPKGKVWSQLALLHPEPTVDNIRELINLERHTRGGTGFHTGEQYYPLIALGVVDPKTLENIFVAFAGDNYDETAQLRDFDPVKGVTPMVVNNLPKISNWLKSGKPEEVPIDLLIPYFKTVFKYVTRDNFGDVEFRLNQSCRNVSRFIERVRQEPEKYSEKKVSIAYVWRDFCLSEQVDTCVKECAQQHFS